MEKGTRRIKGKLRILLAALAVLMLFSTVIVFGANMANPALEKADAVDINAPKFTQEKPIVERALAEEAQASSTEAPALSARPSGKSLSGKAIAENYSDPAAAAVEEPRPVLLPPTNLEGVFVPDQSAPYVSLTWKDSNPPSKVKGYNIYRVDLSTPSDAAPYDFSKKTNYKDYKLELGHTYRYWVTVVGKSGGESEPSNTVDVLTGIPTKPPAPTGVSAAALDPGVGIDWDKSSDPSVVGYNVYYSKSIGSKKIKLNSSLITTTHYYHKEGVAGLYYHVTAVNILNMESDATTVQATAATPVFIEDDNPQINVSGYWKYERYVGPRDGKIRISDEAGARLNLKFRGRQVKLYVATYWSLGSARIYIDGQYITTVNEYSPTTNYNVMAFSQAGLALGDHVLTLELTGTGNPSYPYNFFNVDCFEVR